LDLDYSNFLFLLVPKTVCGNRNPQEDNDFWKDIEFISFRHLSRYEMSCVSNLNSSKCGLYISKRACSTKKRKLFSGSSSRLQCRPSAKFCFNFMRNHTKDSHHINRNLCVRKNLNNNFFSWCEIRLNGLRARCDSPARQSPLRADTAFLQEATW